MQLSDFYTEKGMLAICPTRLGIGTIRAVIDDIKETDIVRLGAKTFKFFEKKVEKDMVGKRISEISIKNGETVFAVMHSPTNIELYNPGVKIRLVETDSIIFGRAID